jgi:membrane-associated phospholipid phosphatase
MDLLLSFGILLIQAIQTLSPALDIPMRFFSFLGTIEFYLLIIPFIYWIVDCQLGFRLLLVLIGTDVLGSAGKLLLHQPRPYWVGDVQALGVETSYGIPSTHASNSLAVWGYLSTTLRKNWIWIVSGALIFLIGLSRLYLGVHFPHDVLGGWLLGLLGIFLFVQIDPVASSFLKKQSQATHAVLGFGISILIIFLGFLIRLLIASSPDPAEWAHYALNARSITHFLTLAGASFGAIAGFSLMWAHARFQVEGSPLQQGGRYLLGIVGVLVIYLGLDILFSLIAGDETLSGYILRYIRYAAVAFWATFGAPWTFLKMKLAQPGSKLTGG